MNKNEQRNSVKSPCVSICALDNDDICTGCHRSGDEISTWGVMSDAQKRTVLEQVKIREQSSYI